MITVKLNVNFNVLTPGEQRPLHLISRLKKTHMLHAVHESKYRQITLRGPNHVRVLGKVRDDLTRCLQRTQPLVRDRRFELHQVHPNIAFVFGEREALRQPRRLAERREHVAVDLDEVEVAANLVKELSFLGAALKTEKVSFGNLADEKIAILRDGVEMKRLQGSGGEIRKFFGLPVFVERDFLFQDDLDGLDRSCRNAYQD